MRLKSIDVRYVTEEADVARLVSETSTRACCGQGSDSGSLLSEAGWHCSLRAETHVTRAQAHGAHHHIQTSDGYPSGRH